MFTWRLVRETERLIKFIGWLITANASNTQEIISNSKLFSNFYIHEGYGADVNFDEYFVRNFSSALEDYFPGKSYIWRSTRL